MIIRSQVTPKFGQLSKETRQLLDSGEMAFHQKKTSNYLTNSDLDVFRKLRDLDAKVKGLPLSKKEDKWTLFSNVLKLDADAAGGLLEHFDKFTEGVLHSDIEKVLLKWFTFTPPRSDSGEKLSKAAAKRAFQEKLSEGLVTAEATEKGESVPVFLPLSNVLKDVFK